VPQANMNGMPTVGPQGPNQSNTDITKALLDANANSQYDDEVKVGGKKATKKKTRRKSKRKTTHNKRRKTRGKKNKRTNRRRHNSRRRTSKK